MGFTKNIKISRVLSIWLEFTKKKQFLILVSLLFISFFSLSFLSAVVKDTSVDPNTDDYYVGNPSNCVWKSSVGNDCPKSGTAICGSDSSEDYCYNVTGDMAQDSNVPASNTTSYSNDYSIEDSNNNPGYVLNCFSGSSSQGDTIPYCNNDGDYWCQTNSTCDGWNRKTKCIEGKFAYESGSSTCTTQCRDGHTSCSDYNEDDTITGTEDCEVNYQDTSVGSRGPADDNSSWIATGSLHGYDAKNATYNSQSCGATCPDGWEDYNNSLQDGCEVNVDADCTINGVSGTIQADGSCVPDKTNFETGTEAEYATSSSEAAMLWFRNADSDGWLINATNATGATFGVDNNSCLVLPDGERVCGKDDLGSGGGGQWTLSENYLYNNSGTLTFNDTLASENLTVNSTDSLNTSEGSITNINATEFEVSGGDLSLNMSFLTGLFIEESEESSLDVNSSDIWRTEEGNLKNVSQINGSDINNDVGWLDSSSNVENLSTDLGEGSVLFSDGENITGNNNSFYWDSQNQRLGLGTNSPESILSVNGSAEFNEGFNDGGLTIEDGDLYAQTGFFYNISSINVSNINTNGSLYPSEDDLYDLGNGTNRWRNLNISQDASIGGQITQGGNDVLDTSDESSLDVNSSDKLRASEGTIDNVSDINGSDINNDQNWINSSQVSGGGVPEAVNLTSDTYTGKVTNGSQVGYTAANSICDQEFGNAHLCSQAEILRAHAENNINIAIGSGWVASGGPKYAPADTPSDDCDGFKSNSNSDYVGNFWQFNSTDGGKGAAATCNLEKNLACCSY